MIKHIIPKGDLAAEHRRLVTQQIALLDDGKAWLVQVQPYQKKRTLQQNAFLHAVPLRMISDFTGYDIEDLKTYLMGEIFGWEEYTIFGQQRRRPVKSTSQLNTEEFAWFLEKLEAWAAAELGMVIPRPNEYII